MSVINGSGLAGIVEKAAARQPDGFSILEAGCGRLRHWAYPSQARISGVDISSRQLERNDFLDDKFLGDVQTWETDRQWDVVVSVYVLEHVDDPRRALANMVEWTKPGGLLVLAVPNALSLKGLVTKMTPFGFHGWFYRNIYRRPHAIFPTVMDFSITPANLRKQLADHEVVLEHFSEEAFNPPFSWIYRVLLGVLRLVSLGQWKPGNSNYLLVVQKPDGAT